MGRKYDLVDVMAAIGLVATLFGGYLLVTAADGFWQAPSVSTMTAATVSSEPSDGMQYLQPALGQAIVDDLLLDRQADSALSASAMELNRAVYDYQQMATTLLSPLALAELRAFGQEADHQHGCSSSWASRSSTRRAAASRAEFFLPTSTRMISMPS